MRSQAWPVLLGALALVGQDAAGTFARRRQSTEDSATMLWLRDPTQLRISQDLRMTLVKQEDFVPIMNAVLANPVGIKNFTIGVMLRRSPLRDDLITEIQIKTLPAVFGASAAHVMRTLVSTAFNTLAYDHEARFRAIPKRTSAIRSCWMINAQTYWLFSPLNKALLPEIA